MTGSSVSDTKSPSCSGSVCSEDKPSHVESISSEKEKQKISIGSGSCKSDATYTKYRKCSTMQNSARITSYDFMKNKSKDFMYPRPRSSLSQRPTKNGIIEPTTHYSTHAQWLPWNDPIFTRRHSTERQRRFNHISCHPSEDHKSTIASFKRSLQLLGLKEKDLGITGHTNENKSANKIPRGRATPTFSTQLKQRSVSLTNLRNAVQESGLSTSEAIEKMHRDILSRAVYEEWYFRKQIENKVKKELEEEIKKQRAQELEWIKQEKRRRAQENFEKWKNMKAQLQKEKKKEDSIKDDKPSSTYAKTKPGADEAFKVWKAKKDEEMKAKESIKKRKEEEERMKTEKERKKAEADAAFKAWKGQIDENWKCKKKEIERQKQIAEAKKEKEIQEKKESANICFQRWKSNKDNEIKQNVMKNRVKAMRTAQEITMKKTEREYEAAQAFEEWLDKVDEREEKEKKTIQHMKSENPPWYPG